MSLNAPFPRSDFGEVRKLSEILFEELDRRFKQFFVSDLRDVSRGTKSGTEIWPSVDQLNLILRCCLVVLNLLELDPSYSYEKARVLLSIMKILVSFGSSGESERKRKRSKRLRVVFTVKFEKLFSREFVLNSGVNGDGCITSLAEDFAASLCFVEPSDPCRPFLCAVLEVIFAKFEKLLCLLHLLSIVKFLNLECCNFILTIFENVSISCLCLSYVKFILCYISFLTSYVSTLIVTM